MIRKKNTKGSAEKDALCLQKPLDEIDVTHLLWSADNRLKFGNETTFWISMYEVRRKRAFISSNLLLPLAGQQKTWSIFFATKRSPLWSEKMSDLIDLIVSFLREIPPWFI